MQAYADKFRILDNGMDGGKHYYTITCPNRTIHTVIAEVVMDGNYTPPTEEQTKARIVSNSGKLKIVQICIASDTGEQCRAKWTVQQAAEESCK